MHFKSLHKSVCCKHRACSGCYSQKTQSNIFLNSGACRARTATGKLYCSSRSLGWRKCTITSAFLSTHQQKRDRKTKAEGDNTTAEHLPGSVARTPLPHCLMHGAKPTERHFLSSSRMIPISINGAALRYMRLFVCI